MSKTFKQEVDEIFAMAYWETAEYLIAKKKLLDLIERKIIDDPDDTPDLNEAYSPATQSGIKLKNEQRQRLYEGVEE